MSEEFMPSVDTGPATAENSVDTRSEEECSVVIDWGKASAEELRAKAYMWNAIASLLNSATKVVETAIIKAME